MIDEARLPHTFAAPVKTERLTVRLMSVEDVDDIHAYQSREDVCRYLLYDPRTRDDVAKRTAENAAATTLAQDGDYWQLAVELQTDAGPRVIGDIYFTLFSAENSTGEIGWTFHPDFARRGYASEAARAVLRIAFDELGLHRVKAELDPRNDASIALCKRLGLREEAHFRQDMFFKGDWADTGVYAILRSEFEAARAHFGTSRDGSGDD